MKAVFVREWTDLANLKVEEVPEPEMGPGDIKIAVHTAGIVFGDTLITAGKYQVQPNLPFVPCSECSGVVEAVGADVSGFAPGDHVAALGFIGKSRIDRKILGALGQKVVAPPRNVVKAPKHIPLEQLALFRSNNETSYYALQRGQVKPGETMLVLGAGGGTGFSAIEIGKLMGLRVIGSASSQEKRDIALKAGADEAIDSNAPDWREQVFALTGGRGVDIVYDPVGGDYSERAFRCLAYGGRLLVVGFAAGFIPKLPLNLPLMKASSVVGANALQGWENEPELFAANQLQLIEWFGEGKLHVPPVTKRYPLDRAVEALVEVSSGKTPGRIVVSVGEG